MSTAMFTSCGWTRARNLSWQTVDVEFVFFLRNQSAESLAYAPQPRFTDGFTVVPTVRASSVVVLRDMKCANCCHLYSYFASISSHTVREGFGILSCLFKIWPHSGFRVIHAEITHKKPRSECSKSMYIAILLEFTEWCEDFKWIHDRSAGHRSERNGIAETAVRQVNEGTSSLLVLSGLPGSSRVGAMECHYYLRKCSGFGGRYRTWRRMCPHRNPSDREISDPEGEASEVET